MAGCAGLLLVVRAAGREMPPVSSIPNALSFLKANLRSITALAAIIAGLMAPSAAAGDASREREVLRFALVRGPWVLESAARPNQHVEALGEQAGVWGSLAGGFEGWVISVQAVRRLVALRGGRRWTPQRATVAGHPPCISAALLPTRICRNRLAPDHDLVCAARHSGSSSAARL